LNNDAALIPSEPVSPASIIPIIPTQPSALHKIFLGKDGLRAGWSLLIFIVLFAALIFCANIIGHKLHPPAAKAAKAMGAELSASRSLSSEFVPFLVVLFITWIMSKIERRPALASATVRGEAFNPGLGLCRILCFRNMIL
jgi:uncharacterized protein